MQTRSVDWQCVLMSSCVFFQVLIHQKLVQEHQKVGGEIMESNVVSGIAYSRDEAKMTLISVADRPGIAAAIFDLFQKLGSMLI